MSKNESVDAASMHPIVITRQALVELSRISEDARSLAERVDKVFWEGKKAGSSEPQPTPVQIELYERIYSIRESLEALSRSKDIKVQNDMDEIARIREMANSAIGLLIYPRRSS